MAERRAPIARGDRREELPTAPAEPARATLSESGPEAAPPPVGETAPAPRAVAPFATQSPDARPAAAAAHADEPRVPEATAIERIVQIHVGRVVVRAPASVARPAPVAAPPPRPTPRLSLADYLARRNGGTP